MPVQPADNLRSVADGEDEHRALRAAAPMKGLMKFLCLAWEDEAKLNELTEVEWDKLRRETLAYVDKLIQAGRLVTAEPLQSAHTAATVQVRDGKRLVKDGPTSTATSKVAWLRSFS